VIGLVGGVGCGKSHLARLLQKKLPIEIVEGDMTGHRVLTEQAVKHSLREAFGERVFTKEGEVNRSEISRLVFGSGPQQQAARKKLEEIVHPRISEILARRVARARSRPDVEAVILDAAILLEAGWRHICDVIVFIDAPFEIRLARVAKSRGWNREQLRSREESQFPLDRKRKEADCVVDNSGDEQVALSQLETVYSRVIRPGQS
jgi:dephospho-CoA kinase